MRHPANRNYRKNPQISCTLNLAAKILEKKVFKEIKRNPKSSIEKSSSSTVHRTYTHY